MTRSSHRQGPTATCSACPAQTRPPFPTGGSSAALQSVAAAQQLSAPWAPCPSTATEVNAGDETEPSSRKSGEETRQIDRVFFESPGTRSNGG